MNFKGLGRKWPWPSWILSSLFSREGGLKKTLKSSARVVSYPASIQISHHLNTNKKCYCMSQLAWLSNSFITS